MKPSTALTILTLAVHSFAAPAPIPKAIAARQASDTENDLVDGVCKALTVIFARGTTESGNVGTLAGPPFFEALYADIGSVDVALQGVDYPASIAGFLEGGDPTGATTMANLVNQAATQCPGTKIVMSGYSQGGQLVHKAAAMLSPALTAKVNSVVIFGDPDNGEAVGSIPSSKVLIICHVGDDICLHGDAILPPHLDYALNAGQAAAFVVELSGL